MPDEFDKQADALTCLWLQKTAQKEIRGFPVLDGLIADALRKGAKRARQDALREAVKIAEAHIDPPAVGEWNFIIAKEIAGEIRALMGAERAGQG